MATNTGFQIDREREKRDNHTLELAKIKCSVCQKQGKPEYEHSENSWCHISQKDPEAIIFCAAYFIWDAHKKNEHNITKKLFSEQS